MATNIGYLKHFNHKKKSAPQLAGLFIQL
ncbi:hypothetical protein CGSHiGG_05920 [Haemophilus influenzae PittGG]|uniref:Uncharacterized protein n=1 Tax=Haemophilus influenzae (strain PittGG) TaxID=374931 RepID=A5UH39_HAEIG|nr:hypothetical protein CGSHiGG_05920 [Haemophilus influenzae PittGG]